MVISIQNHSYLSNNFVSRLSKCIFAISCFLAFFAPQIFKMTDGIPYQVIFCFSDLFYTRNYYWQLCTALIVLPSQNELSFNFLFDTGTLLLLFWITASSVSSGIGVKRFRFFLIFLSIIISLSASFLGQFFILKEPISFFGPVFFAVLYLYLYHPSPLFSMVFWPLSKKWILFFASLLTIGYNLVHEQYFIALLYIIGFFSAYLYGLFVLGIRTSHSSILYFIESGLIKIKYIIKQVYNWKFLKFFRKRKNSRSHDDDSKIIYLEVEDER